jgi:hypothetical protein
MSLAGLITAELERAYRLALCLTGDPDRAALFPVISRCSL